MKTKSVNIIEREFENLRKELLDLTLRNQLLNFKSRAKTITITNQSPMNLYQTLVLQENKMYFVANKKDKKEDKSSVWDHIPFDFSKFSEGDKKLATDLTPKELQKRLYYINNQAKTMLQEQGYNILYLAVGFLEWKDKSKPKQTNQAPLVLIPVSMERKKVGESFNLEWTGEDIQTNISLKAKLLEGGIELPDFEFKKYGEVIDHYIAKVRRVTAHMDGWKVNNNAAIGFFSFTKFVMYNDLNPEAWAENVDLTKNELIQAIFNPAKNDQEAFREEDIDSRLEYQNMYQVLDADSSQIAAIQDVKAGRNLVVEGPPGTGKSQTIVNLIAELLAEGKSVLFVSEKMAALDVVKDRLTSVGLGKFILELHSHKTRRKKFLKDLEKATNVRAQADLNIDQTIRKLETLRRQLDDYSQVIHKPSFAVNLSAFELYGMKESADDHFARKNQIMPLVRFSNPDSITIKDLDDLTLSLENLAELYQTISKENPWSKCAPKSLLPADLREIEMLINDTLLSLDNFLVERGRVYDIYGIKKPDTLNEFENSLSAFEIIKSQNAELIDGSILKSGAWDSNNDDAFRLIQELERYQKYSNKLDKFNSSIFSVNIDLLINQLHELSHKKFRFFNNKQHIDLVERYYSVPVSGSIDDIVRELDEAKAVIKIKNKLDANESLGKKYYGGYWHLGANPEDLKAIAKWMNEFTALVRDGTFSQNTIDLLSKDLFDIRPERDLAEYIDSGEEFVRVLSRLKDKLNPRSKLIFKRETGDVPFEDWREQLYNWRGQLSSLHLWSQYLNTKNAIQGSEASMFIDAIEKRNIKKDDVEALVQGNFADSLLNILFVENQELATFIGELHENRIHEFRDLDKQILELNRKRIYNKLNSNIPQIFGATEHPQAKILAGEFTRKSGHMPVRKLLEKAGGMIKQIKPCFMMSPLSVAQYLDPTNEELQFDVVIFDEASQVKPEDALGAFMRGKTAVVMGDTQQLPPTSFFDQMSDADSDEEEATSLDMESILHLCKLSFPVKMLKWHYRSRHESLISVSNKEFYDNELLVYPSPSHNDPELGLKFHYNPNTAYDRGSSSANPLEAKDVVDEIFNHFDKYGDSKSLGVGTFSVAQKNAILEELEVRRKERPELEPLFSENKDERFFVKNLETIQGDERDVILISVGYGYDNDRKMSLNFGPLNQDGGERRLNVLITRAREKCVVFSNFKAYDMHLTANPPYGVKSLKEFLEYAENLTLGTPNLDEHTKEPFEDAIYSFLVENGYKVDKQIGCAGFRVDLAIVDEENPGKYILGITTDGKMYASSKVARDRDRLREQVLNGLGWKLYHLWSTDWYRNRDLGRKKLLDFIEKSIKETREEEKRRSEEAKRLAEERRKEAEKKAEELRLAREREEAEKEDNEDEIPDIGPEEFVEVEKVDDGDGFEQPIDVSTIDPSEFFEEEIEDNTSNSEFVENDDVNPESVNVNFSEFVENDDSDSEFDDLNTSEFIEDETEEVVYEPLNEKVNSQKSSEVINETKPSEEEVIIKSPEESDDGNSYEAVDVGETENYDDEIIGDINLQESVDVGETENNNDEIDSHETVNVDETESQDDDKEIWELNEEDDSQDDDKEIWESNEEIPASDNAEVWEDEHDYDDEKESPVKSATSWIKSRFTSNDDEVEPSPSVKFTKNLDLDNHNESETNKKQDNSSDEEQNSNLNSEDEFIYVEHGNAEDKVEDDEFDINDYVSKPEAETPAEDVSNDEATEDGEYVDLGSDDDYIYVDHSNDEESIIDYDDNSGDNESAANYDDSYDDETVTEESDVSTQENVKKPRGSAFTSRIMSSFRNAESQLNPEEIETLKGEFIDDGETPLHKPAPKDEFVVEAEIINQQPDDEIVFKDSIDIDDEIHKKAESLVSEAFGEVIEDMLNNSDENTDEEFETTREIIEDNQSEIEDNEVGGETQEKPAQAPTSHDGVTYYQSVSDITNPLKKNNVYYNEHESKSVRDSIKGFTKDMKYIKNSLDEIENPTPSQYVSVVDRTEEYDPEDYLNRESDDDSQKIIEKENELTFAEKEELRYKKELEMEALKKEIASDENVIIPNHEVERREELKDQALEDIIQIADEDYKEIEKERFQNNNKLKAFDDKKLPGKKKLSDEITDYVEAADIGLNSSSDLYNKPSSEVAKAINNIVDIEGPIHISEVTRRVKDSCGVQRAGSKLKKAVNDAVSEAENEGNIIKIGDFLYDANNSNVLIRRRNKPKIDLISDEEIAKNIELILLHKENMSPKSLTKEASRNFGFKSTSKKTASRINSVLDLMIADNKVKLDKDIVELN